MFPQRRQNLGEIKIMNEMELIESVKSGNLPEMKQALSAGVDIHQLDKQGWTALNWAAAKGNLEAVKMLVENGADVFKTGRDLRTPAMIALAAGQAEAAKLLREVQEQVPGETHSQSQRKYCISLHLKDLRQFPNWKENTVAEKSSENGSADQSLSDSSIVYLHENFVVTKSIWQEENVIFNDVTREWKHFCITVLKFRVPDDLEFIAPTVAKSKSAN
jgi:ankyrin repeat protein